MAWNPNSHLLLTNLKTSPKQEVANHDTETEGRGGSGGNSSPPQLEILKSKIMKAGKMPDEDFKTFQIKIINNHKKADALHLGPREGSQQHRGNQQTR